MKRYLLYHSFAKSIQEEIKSDYTIKEISVCSKNRSYLAKSDYMWNFVSFGRLRKIVILNEEKGTGRQFSVLTDNLQSS